MTDRMSAMEHDETLKWYCLRSQPKHEHIAAAHLRKMGEIEVYAPQVRIQRVTRRGLVWFQESLFPSYLFARFEKERRTEVRYAHGVAGLVHFGQHDATMPDSAIEQLRIYMGGADVIIAALALAPGDEVEIVEGPLRGGTGVVTQILPARERVKVLVEFLGGVQQVEFGLTAVFRSPTSPIAQQS